MIVEAGAADAGKRLDAFLHERLPEWSRSRLQAWMKDGRVRIGDRTVRAAQLVRGDEQISIEPSAAPPLRASPEDLPLEILYEDDDLVVVNKAAGVVVHAGAGHASGTLVNALLHHFGGLSTLNGELRPGIVHRLDRDTSGVLVVARTDRSHIALARQFHDREVEKIYLALANGTIDPPAGSITLPIARDPLRRTRMSTRVKSGRAALTEYRLLEKFKNASYLEVRLRTGRTHQIRVHLASRGHPLVGDRLYGAPASPLGRFFLHAHRLGFRSPSSGKWITIESPLPGEFAQFLHATRAERG